jgi:hypothetical protein
MNKKNKREYALLIQLRSVLDYGVKRELSRGRKYQRILSAVGGILVLAGFYLVRFRIISGELGVMMAAVAGLAIGLAGYIAIVRRILPFIAPHLNEASIKARLQAIEQD